MVWWGNDSEKILKVFVFHHWKFCFYKSRKFHYIKQCSSQHITGSNLRQTDGPGWHGMYSGWYCCVLRTWEAPFSMASSCKKHQIHHRFDLEWFGCCMFRNLRLLPNISQCPPIRVGDPLCGHAPRWAHLAFKTLNMSYLHVNYNQSCLVSKEMPEAHVDVTFVSCDRRQQKKKKKAKAEIQQCGHWRRQWH